MLTDSRKLDALQGLHGVGVQTGVHLGLHVCDGLPQLLQDHQIVLAGDGVMRKLNRQTCIGVFLVAHHHHQYLLHPGLAARLDPVVAGEHPELAVLLPVAQGQG